MIQPKQILVATDFSEVSTAAIDYGRDLARTFGASLQLLHVRPTRPISSCWERTGAAAWRTSFWEASPRKSFEPHPVPS